jgi:hypothetical protein
VATLSLEERLQVIEDHAAIADLQLERERGPDWVPRKE